MKRFGFVAVVLLLCLASTVIARDTKIGIIISARILEEYPEAVSAQETLSSEINEWQRQAQQMEEEIIALQQELEQQAAMFYSEERRQERENEYRTKINEYRTFQMEIEQRAMQRNQELFEPINERIQEIIDQIATEDGFDIIFDAVGTNIAYLGDQTLDITDRVLQELNRQ